MTTTPLTPAQRAALAHVEQHALGRRQQAQETLDEVCSMAHIAPDLLARTLALIQTEARVVLHFHPDRRNSQGLSVAEALLQQGVYRNQFETGLSNGKLSPLPDGPRDRWESQLFGSAYAAAGVAAAHRPKYGALDLLRHPDGPSPRFGSCYLVLQAAVTQRCSFSYLDSHRSPDERGTLAVFEDVLAALLLECFEREYALGERDIKPAALLERICSSLQQPYPDPAGRLPGRNLNHYIEAQVHGPVALQGDVEMLVADPSFKNSTVGELLHQLSERYSMELRWHGGFCMPAAAVPQDFRGAGMPSLAHRIAEGGCISARQLGQAAAALQRHPERWSDRGSAEACLQELKLLWHVLVRYGSPVAEKGV